jgi:hypothetical protein
MKQNRKLLVFLLVIISASIVTTRIRLGWFGTKSTWQQIGNDIDGEAAVDRSGYSVSLSSDGKILAVGAPFNDGNGSYSGNVRIFQWTESTSTWTQMGADIDGEAWDYSGWSVSLSSDGKILAVGAPFNNLNVGHVRIFQWIESKSIWKQMGADIDGEELGDWSGYSVSLSSDGNIAAIGAPFNYGNGHLSGNVRIFQFTESWTESTSSWKQMGVDIDGEAEDYGFGYSLSLSSDGKTVAIAAPGENANGDGGNDYSNSGHVRIFQWIDSTYTWKQLGADIEGEVYNARYRSGSSVVSLSSDGKTVAFGGPHNDGNGDRSGHVRIFQWTESTSTWTQVGADIDGEKAGDDSGSSVSLSSDGKTVAFGAPYNDGNGSSSGHVRIFQWIESKSIWKQMGADIDGEERGDGSGWSVSLSSDGKTVAIGAPGNDGNGYKYSGHVRIFQWRD